MRILLDTYTAAQDASFLSPCGYRTNLKMPVTGLFDAFSIYFACPLKESMGGKRYMLIAVEHLKRSAIVRATLNATSAVFIEFF